jgi:ribosomal protein L11 methyltransferase
MGSYFKLRISGLSQQAEDIVTQICFDYGSTGLSEALVYRQPNLAYDPQVVATDHHTVEAFFTERPREELLVQLRNLYSHLQIEILEEQEKDWLEEWKKGFEPFALAGPYWVVPSWKTPPAEAQRPLFIEPGMAFGTGTHATTQMAAHLVYRAMKTSTETKAIKTVIDVGAGTGILSMIAEGEHAEKIVAVEIDPEARRVARENFAQNKTKCCQVVDESLDQVHRVFDLVIANIIDGVLLALKTDLLACMAEDGHMILSGILAANEDEFLEQFLEQTQLQVVRRLEKDEWIGFWLRNSTGNAARA